MKPTSEELLQQILAAQLAQVALLQTIAANVDMQNPHELGEHFVTKVDLTDALKAVNAAGEHLAPTGTGDGLDVWRKLGQQS